MAYHRHLLAEAEGLATGVTKQPPSSTTTTETTRTSAERAKLGASKLREMWSPARSRRRHLRPLPLLPLRSCASGSPTQKRDAREGPSVSSSTNGAEYPKLAVVCCVLERAIRRRTAPPRIRASSSPEDRADTENLHRAARRRLQPTRLFRGPMTQGHQQVNLLRNHRLLHLLQECKAMWSKETRTN